MSFLSFNLRLSIVLLVFAGTTPAIAQDCNCADNFAWVQEKLRLNYAGYGDKVNTENQEEFDQHTVAYGALIDTVRTDSTCQRVILEWSDWFQDGHVQLRFNQSEEDPMTIRQRYAEWEQVALSEAEFRTYLNERKNAPIEGIWQSAVGNYRVGIIRSEDPARDFVAFVIEADSVWWMPGQVKFELVQAEHNAFQVKYYMRNHSLQEQTGQLDELYFNISNLGGWYQIYPETGAAPSPDAPTTYSLEQLDSQTLLLRMPTMNENFRKELIALMDANEELMESTPNWIIDCRGNGGGSDITYFPLRPYIATGDIHYDHTRTWATEDNAEKYANLRHDKNFPWLQRIAFGRYARRMRRNAGQFIGSSKKCSSVVRTKRVRPIPEQVVILVDGGCASSCESFLLFSRQSDKVTLMGQSSAGILDYGNLHWIDSQCGSFTLFYPTSRSCRVDAGRGIDNHGIPPDVELSAEADWLEEAQRYLRGIDR